MSKNRRKTKREPKQRRSRETVDVIAQGAVQVLLREGYTGLTTRSVAKAAGVSIGTLYQYFDDKNEVLSAVIERDFEQVYAAFSDLLAKVADLPLREGIRVVVTAMVQGYAAESALRKVLDEQMPKIYSIDRTLAYYEKARKVMRSYLEIKKHELRVEDLDGVAWIMVTACDTLYRSAVAYHPELLVGGRVIELVEDLLIRFLVADDPAQTMRPGR